MSQAAGAAGRAPAGRSVAGEKPQPEPVQVVQLGRARCRTGAGRHGRRGTRRCRRGSACSASGRGRSAWGSAVAAALARAAAARRRAARRRLRRSAARRSPAPTTGCAGWRAPPRGPGAGTTPCHRPPRPAAAAAPLSRRRRVGAGEDTPSPSGAGGSRLSETGETCPFSRGRRPGSGRPSGAGLAAAVAVAGGHPEVAVGRRHDGAQPAVVADEEVPRLARVPLRVDRDLPQPAAAQRARPQRAVEVGEPGG